MEAFKMGTFLSGLYIFSNKYFVMIASAIIIPTLIGSTFSADVNAYGNQPRDCDSNAVIRCGAYSISELKRKYKNQSGAKDIFSDFGITKYDMNHMRGHVRNGKVTKGGRVMVDGKVVARNAYTAGRQNMSGSTTYSNNGTTYYMRPTSASFASNSLSSYVVMKNGRFDYAIIKSCGNPVIATPVVKKREKPIAAPVAPTPPPPTQAQSQVQSQSVTVVTPPPAKNVVKKELPKTGPADIIAIGALTAIFSTFGHMIYQRRKL
jgi:hypothetical protein